MSEAQSVLLISYILMFWLTETLLAGIACTWCDMLVVFIDFWRDFMHHVSYFLILVMKMLTILWLHKVVWTFIIMYWVLLVFIFHSFTLLLCEKLYIDFIYLCSVFHTPKIKNVFILNKDRFTFSGLHNGDNIMGCCISYICIYFVLPNFSFIWSLI
jgi:hypothetical protein